MNESFKNTGESFVVPADLLKFVDELILKSSPEHTQGLARFISALKTAKSREEILLAFSEARAEKHISHVDFINLLRLAG